MTHIEWKTTQNYKDLYALSVTLQGHIPALLIKDRMSANSSVAHKLGENKFKAK